MQRRGGKRPPRPVIPCTTTRVLESTRIDICAPSLALQHRALKDAASNRSPLELVEPFLLGLDVATPRCQRARLNRAKTVPPVPEVLCPSVQLQCFVANQTW